MTGTHVTGGRAVLPVVLSATFVQLLNVTVAQVAAPSIQAGLGMGPGAVRLVLAGYTLTYACLLITAARLGDRYGYRRLFAIGTAIFLMGSLACAAAPGPAWLVAARLVQGAGSGLVAPQVLSIIQVAVPERGRARAMGLYGATMGIASLAGPLAGGLLAGFGWRPVFLVTVPVALISLAGAALLPAARGTGSQRVDVTGAVLVTAGFGALLLPLTLGREVGRPWWTWAGLAASVVLLAAFALTLRRPDALIHPSVLRDRTARWGVTLVFVFNAGVPSFTYLLMLHLQTALGRSPLAAALISAPFAAAAIAGSRAAPALSARHGPRVLTAAALALAVTVVTLPPLLNGPWATAPLAVGGGAFGVFTASVFALVPAGVGRDAAGSVSGLLPTAQQLGGTIGVALGGLAYAAAPGGSFWYAMTYEGAVFAVTALISLRPAHPGRRRVRRTASPPTATDASVRIAASVHWKRQNRDGGW
ncbi:MFS transporter [Nonomuraea sp. NPDC052634]|uniref:MFS transporter n=1 Tax=Nonomuraea sp. NPDC052634 TaxID=3155813 RepID=UPI003420A72F